MKFAKILGVAGFALCFSMSALATTVTPQQPNGAEGSNVWLYQIYNTLYGTSLPDTNAIVPLEIDPATLDFSALGSDAESVTFDAVWRQAFLQDTFGMYPVGNSADRTDLLGPFLNFTPGNPGQLGQGDLRSQGISTTVPVAGLGNTGFYLNVQMASDLVNNDQVANGPVLFRWYSQEGLNSSNEVHMLLLTTDNPDVYLLAFEDLPYQFLNENNQDLGDQDYQDLLIQLTVNRTVVPEPTSIALLGLGLAGLAARRFLKLA